MTAKYFAILTNQGAARLANAAALGTKLNLTQMAVGDANGTLPTPDPAQTKLINQKRIAPLNLLTVDPANTSQIIAEQIIPENEGGFWIREIGLYDDDGILIAVANCPETYKPELQEGSGRTQTIRMILIVSSTSAITLKIDPSVVLATRQYVDDKVIEVKSYADGLMRAHEQSRNHPDATTTAKGFTQLNSSVTDDRETQSATPKAVKIAMDNANARLSKERNLSDLPNPALARQNLQLGDSSTKNTGTTANTVAAGDDARITGAMQKSQNGADIQDVAKFLQNLQLRESFSGVVGQSRNARMSVAAASATATFSADELIVEDSVGRQYRVTSFSKVINLATTGAGGMDTGVVPATGFVALYVIYNPTTGTSALLAVDTTSTAAPEIYGGANMPAGFTASALVSIWRVVSGKFIVGEQRGRDISIIDVNAVTTTTATSSLTAISVASAIPKNAKSVAGWAGTQSTGSSTVQSVRIAGSVQIVGMRLIQVNSATAINAPYTLPILTEQTIYYSNETSGTLVSAAIFINEYSF
ncbi:phage tail protein [Citrobacter freundii]|nr:phage tail protein [Citrobacter freundii]WFZ84295.1 phage tail protein [Citrobacter freundii]